MVLSIGSTVVFAIFLSLAVCGARGATSPGPLEAKQRAANAAALGTQLHHAGDAQYAVTAYLKALAIHRHLRDRAHEDDDLINLALAYEDLSRHRPSSSRVSSVRSSIPTIGPHIC